MHSQIVQTALPPLSGATACLAISQLRVLDGGYPKQFEDVILDSRKMWLQYFDKQNGQQQKIIIAK